MGRYKNITPEGAFDLLFNECETRKAVEGKMVSVFKGRGFNEIASPLLEYYDVFSGNSSVMDDELMYKLIDAHGRILVLRPDNTTPIARIASTRLKDYYPPFRLCYNQHVFRISPKLSGRYDEVSQCGVELIGGQGLKADIEVILTAVEALRKVLGDNFSFEIGHVGFYKSIIDELPFPDEKKEQIRSLVAAKNYASLNIILEPLAEKDAACRALTELPHLFGGREILERALALAPNSAARETAEYLQTLFDVLCGMGLEGSVILDLGLVQQIEYYTGVVFRGYMQGSGEPVLSGGRYDRLLAYFGADMPACGFAVDADAIMRACAAGSDKSRTDVIIFTDSSFEHAYRQMGELIASGITCEMSVFDTLEETREYAAKKHIRRIDIVTDDEEVIREEL